MVISPASLVTLSTDRWEELGEFLARRAEPTTETTETTEDAEEGDPDGQH